MKKVILSIFIFVFCLSFSVLAQDAVNAQAKILADLEPMVADTLAGYNAENYEEYFMHFAKSMKAIATPQVFKNMVMNMWKKKVGEFKSRVLVEKKCSFNDDFPLLVFEGTFKNSKMMISVNFMKEDGKYKIMQFRIDPEKK